MTIFVNQPHGPGQFLAVGVLKGDVGQPSVTLRRWRTTLTQDRIEPDMVMVVPGGQEYHAVGWLIGRVVGDVEAEEVTIEDGRAIDIGDH